MTTEERKIKRLESQVQKLKEEVQTLTDKNRQLESMLSSERGWRQDFQNLLKAAVQEDNLKDYERSYW
jgi:predicted  nucleic acid-binding Zn-ribbon protein